MTIEELYQHMSELNSNNGWVNPVLKKITNEEFENNFFMIQVDDFLEIESDYMVEVYRVSKRWGEIIIYCKRVVYDY